LAYTHVQLLSALPPNGLCLVEDFYRNVLHNELLLDTALIRNRLMSNLYENGLLGPRLADLLSTFWALIAECGYTVNEVL
jgi:hypothetical protein